LVEDRGQTDRVIILANFSLIPNLTPDYDLMISIFNSRRPTVIIHMQEKKSSLKLNWSKSYSEKETDRRSDMTDHITLSASARLDLPLNSTHARSCVRDRQTGNRVAKSPVFYGRSRISDPFSRLPRGSRREEQISRILLVRQIVASLRRHCDT